MKQQKEIAFYIRNTYIERKTKDEAFLIHFNSVLDGSGISLWKACENAYKSDCRSVYDSIRAMLIGRAKTDKILLNDLLNKNGLK